MTTINTTHDDSCPEATGVEQMWSGDVFIGYQVFMDEDDYKSYLVFKSNRDEKARQAAHLERHIASLGPQ
jgi:hypothetical protein